MNGNTYYVSLAGENSVAVLVDAFDTGDESRYFHGEFEEKSAIRNLPANIQVEVKDAYETDQPVFLILGMSWEAWAL